MVYIRQIHLKTDVNGKQSRKSYNNRQHIQDYFYAAIVYTQIMIVYTLTQRLIRIGLIGTATLMFLFVSRPSDIPAILLIAPFIGIFSFLYLIVLEIVRFLGPDEDENGAIVRVKRPRLMAATLAGFPVLLLVLQSVVELTFWDVLIALTILLLAYVYISRSSVNFWR